MEKIVDELKAEVRNVLETNILPYWMEHMQDEEHGGFYGRITGTEVVMPETEKGAILNARILWTFSAAYRLLRKAEYLAAATRAKDYIIEKFYDKEYGGVYWSLDAQGHPLDTKKQIYAIGFAIYGLSEYNRATGDAEALTYVIHLFESIERYSFDAEKNGYCEALTREWGEMADMRLSDKDENERKTMNTHLHILEAYTNLCRVWRDERLVQQLRNLILLFIEKIYNPETRHLELFFDDNWCSKYHIISYGHDIEASWLIHEAALVLGDEALIQRVEPIVKGMADAADEGLTPDGGLIYEYFVDKSLIDTDRHWWVQAENVLGHINLYQYFRDENAFEIALNGWDFIKRHLIDEVNGEWYWSVSADGELNVTDDKAGFWKCPYHNGRMCMEIMERKLSKEQSGIRV